MTETITNDTKKCKLCNTIKDKGEFDKNRAKCKKCRSERNHNYYMNNKTTRWHYEHKKEKKEKEEDA
jgi:hypothetical protein